MTQFDYIPSFDYREPDVYIVKIGTGALAAVTATTNSGLGQVKSISGRTTASRNKKTFRRLSSGTATTAYGSVDYSSTFDLMLYAEDDNTALIKVLSDAAPSSTIDATLDMIIVVEVYDSISSGTLKHTWYLTGANLVESGFDSDADGDAGMTPIRFESPNRWILETVTP